MSDKTKIIQCFLPSLVAGVYHVKVRQDITKGGADGKPVETNISKELKFGVDAARFTLNPQDIYSVYPPANKSSNAVESLPHIVFTRRTLPWERTIDGKPPACQVLDAQGNKRSPKAFPPVPWMALLLFDDDDMKDLKIAESKVADVIRTTAKSDVTRPEIEVYIENGPDDDKMRLMKWDNPATDGCFTIDITKEQFQNDMPSIEDLKYLAHAKEVSIHNKDKEGITDINTDNGTGVFSVVVGNRLPTKDKRHTAMLVSLEGFHNYLRPEKDKQPVKTIDTAKVRLVVLASWKFECSGDATFLQLVNGLVKKPMQIKKGLENAQSEFAKELSPYYDSGYVAMEHLTRIGATTLSWYHGPFIPKLSPKSSKSISFPSADSALRYDKATGFFDISFATAWQLGRMLALQNQNFSKAILNWRILRKQNEVRDGRNAKMNEITGDTTPIPLKQKVIKYLGGNVSVSTASHNIADSINTIPPEIMDFLGNLYRLNGIPFNYIVPDELFLEKSDGTDSMTGTFSFFYVDQNWIEALLDGALSMGRVENTDDILEKAMSGDFIKELVKTLKSTNGESAVQRKDVNLLNVTGFLLRSDLVSGWRGIEIEAFDSDNNLLDAFRFEQADEDIFLAVFNGNVASVVITQPYEGLHFGIKVDDTEYNRQQNTVYRKDIKDENGINKPGDGDGNVNDKLNGGIIKNGVIQVAELAKYMKQKLEKKGWLKGSEGFFTSAEFAFQMVDSPVKHTIVISQKKTAK